MKYKYKVVFQPAVDGFVEMKGYKAEFNSAGEARSALNTIADYTLFLHSCGLMGDHSNVGEIMEWSGSEWVTMEDEE